MAQKKVGEASREGIISLILSALREAGYDVLQVGSASYAIPVVEDGEEGAVRLKAEIPKGARDGEGYDPFEEAQSYSFKCEEARKKKEKREADKAKKIAKAQEKKES